MAKLTRLAGPLALVALAGGCAFPLLGGPSAAANVGPITFEPNRAIGPGEAFRFKADITSPDGGRLEVRWVSKRGTLTQAGTEASWSPLDGRGEVAHGETAIALQVYHVSPGRNTPKITAKSVTIDVGDDGRATVTGIQ